MSYTTECFFLLNNVRVTQRLHCIWLFKTCWQIYFLMSAHPESTLSSTLTCPTLIFQPIQIFNFAHIIMTTLNCHSFIYFTSSSLLKLDYTLVFFFGEFNLWRSYVNCVTVLSLLKKTIKQTMWKNRKFMLYIQLLFPLLIRLISRWIYL